MTYDKQNIFARILRGEIPCKPVFENEYVLAFNDLYPKAPTHILVIPKGEYINIHDFGTNATAKEIEEFFRALAKIAGDHGLSEAGFRTIANTGLNGGQEIPHFHIHLIGGKRLGAMIGESE